MKKNLIYFIGLIFLMAACYPGENVYYEDTDLTYTSYDESFDFVSKGTYVMPDKIVKVTGNIQEGENPEFVKEPYNTQILNKIESNMTALGWKKIDDPETADLALFPAAWSNTTVYYYYDYWCWYYPYYCGWGWYGGGSYSSYTTGTLVMGLIAKDGYVDPTDVWRSAINGLLSGAYDVTRVNNAIDQAFKQSPYLNTK